jgi:hypothetical protein
MPWKPRSIESRIAEHTRYRRQCQVRIKPGLQVVGVAACVSGALLWWQPSEWILPAVIVLFPAFFTVMEYWWYLSHDRALKRLAAEQGNSAPDADSSARGS